MISFLVGSAALLAACLCAYKVGWHWTHDRSRAYRFLAGCVGLMVVFALAVKFS